MKIPGFRHLRVPELENADSRPITKEGQTLILARDWVFHYRDDAKAGSLARPMIAELVPTDRTHHPSLMHMRDVLSAELLQW